MPGKFGILLAELVRRRDDVGRSGECRNQIGNYRPDVGSTVNAVKRKERERKGDKNGDQDCAGRKSELREDNVI